MTRLTGRPPSAARLAIRVGTVTPATSLLVVLLVAAIAFLGAAAPALLQRAQTDSLRYALDSIDPTARDVEAAGPGVPRVGAGDSRASRALPDGLDASWGGVLDQLVGFQRLMGPELRDIVGDPHILAFAAPTCATGLDGFCGRPPLPTTSVILTVDPTFTGRVEWLDGRAPQAQPAGSDDSAPFELALSQPAAEQMKWPIGEQRLLAWGQGVTRTVELVGTYAATDPDDPAWDHARTSLRPTAIAQGLAPPTIQAIGYTAAGELGRLAPLAQIVRYEAWYPILVDRVSARTATDVVTQVREFGTVPVELDVILDGFLPGTVFVSTLPNGVADAQPRLAALAALGSLLATGPLVVAVVTLVLAARLLALRRAATARLAASRGGSLRLLATTLGIEGLILGVGGALVGVLVAFAIAGVSGPEQLAVPVIVGLSPAVALAISGLGLSRLGIGPPRDEAARTRRRWRLGAELTVVGLALAASVIVVLRGRAPSTIGIDPLLSALPVLLAAAGCVAALRVLPALLAAASHAAPRRRGLVAVLGPAVARLGRSLRVAPVLATVVGVAIAVFSVGFLSTIDDGIRVAARTTIGADLRLTAAYINQHELDDLATVPGVRAIAPVYADEDETAELPTGDATVTVYVIDTAELRAVQDDAASAIPLPDSLTDTTGDTVPVVMSQELVDRAGDGEITVRDEELDPVAIAPSATPLGFARTWIAVDRANADRVLSQTFSPSTALIALEPGANAHEVARTVVDLVGTDASTTTPAEAFEVRAADPGLAGVRGALIASLSVVGALLLATVVLALFLGAPVRRRLLAVLATQGFPRAKELSVVVWELAPALLVAVPIGVVVGLALTPIVVASLDLTGFVGGAEQPAVQLGGVAVVLVAVGFAVVTLLAILIAAVLAGRSAASRTLRTPDDEG